MSSWAETAAALAEVRRRELRALTDEEGVRVAADLLDLVRLLPPKVGGSGLVEQQRVFGLARR